MPKNLDYHQFLVFTDIIVLKKHVLKLYISVVASYGQFEPIQKQKKQPEA